MPDWMKELQKLEGAVVGDYNPFAHIVDTESPSLNFTYGNTWGLPKGYSVALWGPRKGGKSLIANMMAAKTHRDDPEAFVIKFNTEARELIQFPPDVREKWGIDNKRYICYEVNSPSLIFDRIAHDFLEMHQRGMKIGLVIIDSIQQIRGRRSLNAESVDQQQIGDHAATLKEGFQRILQAHRECKFGLAVVCQVAAEMDKHEVMRGHTIKMNAPNAVQHYCEYIMYVEEILAKDGRLDELGNPLVNTELEDLYGNADATGHKIKVTMRANSCGPKGRVGVFTIDYKKGVINVHEEVFKLGVARGVITKPDGNEKAHSFIFGDKKWPNRISMLEALSKDLDLQRAVVKELKKRDLQGAFLAADKLAEKEAESRIILTGDDDE